MRFLLAILFITVLLASLAWGQQSVGPTHIIYPSKMDISAPLRDLAKPIENWELLPEREIPNRPSRKIQQGPVSLDGALQTAAAGRTFGPPTLNFEGLDNTCNCFPPDPNYGCWPESYRPNG